MELRLLFLFLFFLLFPWFGVIGSNSPNIIAGRDIYMSICSSCHGINGKASINYAPSFYYGERLDKDISILVKSVREGLGRMAPQEGNLKDLQITDAISYARTLQKYFKKEEDEDQKYEEYSVSGALVDQKLLPPQSRRENKTGFYETNENGQSIFFNYDGSIWTN